MPVRKKMSDREVKERQKVKKELQEKGILPPDKKPLNRKKFAEEVLTEFEGFFDEDDLYVKFIYLQNSMHGLLPSLGMLKAGVNSKITEEQIGILKLIKIAMEYKKFEKQVKESGKSKYSFGDLFDKVFKPVIDL